MAQVKEVERYTTATVKGVGGVLCSPSRVGNLVYVVADVDGERKKLSVDEWQTLLSREDVDYSHY